MFRRLSDFNPVWILLAESCDRIGMHFDCPVCGNHTIEVGWAQPNFWRGRPLWGAYGNSFDTMTILGTIDNRTLTKGSCLFVGYISRGLVHW